MFPHIRESVTCGLLAWCVDAFLRFEPDLDFRMFSLNRQIHGEIEMRPLFMTFCAGVIEVLLSGVVERLPSEPPSPPF